MFRNPLQKEEVRRSGSQKVSAQPVTAGHTYVSANDSEKNTRIQKQLVSTISVYSLFVLIAEVCL